MIVLGIETATRVCGAALVRDGKLISEHFIHKERIHSEKLLAIIDIVLAQNSSYDVIAVSIGPGSFTGLRIGTSVAKGLSLASGKPVIAVSTLEALAFKAVQEGFALNGDIVIGMIDARRSDVYAAAYVINDGGLSVIWDPCAISVDEVLQKSTTMGKVIAIGDAVSKFQEHCQRHAATTNIYFPPIDKAISSAGSVAMLGEKRGERGLFTDIAMFEPLYIRDFQSLVDTQHGNR